MKKLLVVLALCLGMVSCSDRTPDSQTAVNPLMYADTPDPDVLRVGDDYYMVSTTMYFCPMVPIMHSKDLVHWQIVSYVTDDLGDGDWYTFTGGKNAYGKGQWATSLKYRDGWYYALFITNEQQKTFIYRTRDITASGWEKVAEFDSFFHDASLYFEDDRVFVVYGNTKLYMTELSNDCTEIIGEPRLVVDFPREGFILGAEGSRFLKKDGWYYLVEIDWPAGGVRTARCWRSRDIYGPYEPKVICSGTIGGRGDGVAQGTLVDTPKGDWYAILFQDHGAVGRLCTVQPVSWVDDWPIVGDNTRPLDTVTVNLAPCGEDYVWADDEFDGNELPLVWQWNHKPLDGCWSLAERKGWLRLTTGQLATGISDARNTLTQRTAGPYCRSEVKMDAAGLKPGDFAGICTFQSSRAAIGVSVGADGSKSVIVTARSFRQPLDTVYCKPLGNDVVWFGIDYDFNNDTAVLDYSYDGREWTSTGFTQKMRFTLDYFTGYRTGLFCYATSELGGYADFDWFHQEVSSVSEKLGLRVGTANGIVEGLAMDNGVKAFLGIPFAEAPVGELRWAAPQPKSDWKGVLETKTFGNDPMQPIIYSDMIFRGPERSEDCLYLNVWTNAATTADKLPVLIYFNGGGLMAGSGSEPRYDGAAIAAEGVIGVTANYREGIFGFFSHPELTAASGYNGSGNYGFLDQVAAIDWVKENIAAFGGDPERITIAGESAGSFSVSLLMVSPLSKNKIAGAILSSGAEVLPYGAVTQDKADAGGAARLESKGISGIAEARALSADELQAIFPPAGMANVILDGYFMPEEPDAVFAGGGQAQVPLLAGWNAQEGVPSFGGKEPGLQSYKEAMSGRFGDWTEEIFNAYGLLSDEDVFTYKGYNLASDLFTGFPTWKVCDYQARTTAQPVFRYKFNKARPRMVSEPEDAPTAFGAVHSADIEYAMGNLPTNEVYAWTDEDYEISGIFLAFYANFCRNGNPNGEGLPVWKPINGKLGGKGLSGWKPFKGNLDDKLKSAPVMQIDAVSASRSDRQIENAYRTLERFYRSR